MSEPDRSSETIREVVIRETAIIEAAWAGDVEYGDLVRALETIRVALDERQADAD